jgi:hypothetical protein
MRIYYVEHGTFANPSLFTDGAQVTNGGLLGVSNNDLAGRYFSSECYMFDGAPSANAFTVKCDGGQSTAPFGSEVGTIVVTIDEGGDLVRVFSGEAGAEANCVRQNSTGGWWAST